jgi:hypothetical protein
MMVLSCSPHVMGDRWQRLPKRRIGEFKRGSTVRSTRVQES